MLGEVRARSAGLAADARPRRRQSSTELKTNPPPLPVDEIAEAIQFLQWLLADNFTFLGVRNYRVDGQVLEPDFDSALGIMRSREVRVLKRGNELLEITPEIMAFLKEPRLLIIAKANIHARVHRRVYLDYIGVKRFDASGNSSASIASSGCSPRRPIRARPTAFPICAARSRRCEQRAGFDPGSHSGKALANVLEHYPRDELFQIDEDTLYRFALAILQLDERPRVRVLARHDRFDRFVSVLVFVPRERYDSDMRAKIGAYLASAFNGRVSAFYPLLPRRRAAGARAFHHRPLRRRDAEVDRATLERRSRRSSAPGPMGSPRRSRCSIRRTRRASCSSATGTHSRRDTTRPMRRRLRRATSA